MLQQSHLSERLPQLPPTPRQWLATKVCGDPTAIRAHLQLGERTGECLSASGTRVIKCVCVHAHLHVRTYVYNPPPPQVEQDAVNLTTAKVQFSEDSKVMIDVSLQPFQSFEHRGVCVYQLVRMAGCVHQLGMTCVMCECDECGCMWQRMYSTS